MSKIKFSALVSDMRNKLNGSVLSKNRYGNYMRNKVTPVNPQTSYQLNQRAQLSALSSAWRGLTQSQRDSWQSLAATLPRTDIFGDPKILSGNALYVSLNLNLAAAGQPTIDDAPTAVSVPAVVVSDLLIGNDAGVLDGGTFSIDPATVPAGYSLMVYATPGVSPGVNFVKNQFRLLGTFTASSGEVDFGLAYSARFGVPAVGQKVFVRAALCANDTGQLGLPSEAMTIVTQA